MAVHFKGVFQIADVWVNGKSVGRHVGGFTGFQFDVSDLLQWNGPNLLAVRVEDVLNPEIAPAKRDQWGRLWWNLPQRIPSGDGPAARRSERNVGNDGGERRRPHRTNPHMDREQRQDRCKRRAEYAGRGRRRSDRCHTRCQRDCRTRGDEGVDQKTGVLLGAHLWSPDTPYLYRVMSMIVL